MVLQVQNLSKSFDSKRVLNEITFEAPQGEIFSLIGPNGAGKTTTLRCIYGGLIPDEGKVKLFGEPLNSQGKTRLGVLTEDRLKFGRFRGEDYVRLWKMLYPRWSERIFSSFAMHYQFDLSQKVENYSMGIRTLFHLSLILASGAELLLLDEPTQNLDPVIRQEVLEVLRDFVHQEGRSVVISSHELYELEEISTSFAIIREGVVLYHDTMDHAKESHRLVDSGEKIPVGNVVGVLGNRTLIKTDEEVGDFPTFKEIALAYLQGKRAFVPFEMK
ncbi:MAG TPA: ABC transporter ATP-binding protein [Thermotogota bacterium]|nr:ABC transporter ATP-binding protein [Thermotogota bacterium]HRW92495.1 ABC transporter ATP-binding protein [Thermotogota bacterium]